MSKEREDEVFLNPRENLLGCYLSEIRKYPLLNREEEFVLFSEIHLGDAERIQVARKKLVESNMPLVVSVAKSSFGLGVPKLDLIQEGNLGLMEAIKNFDLGRGYKFSTYATWWIRGYVKTALREDKLIPMSEHTNGTLIELREATWLFEQSEGRKPTKEELAEITKISSLRIDRAWRAETTSQVVSLNKSVGGDEDTEFGDFIADEKIPMPLEVVERASQEASIDELLNVLSARERVVIVSHYGLFGCKNKLLKEIARSWELTPERIRQIREEGLRRLRKRESRIEEIFLS